MDIHTQLIAPVHGETAKTIVSSSQVILVPLSLLALRNERVEMMKLKLTKLTSAFIEDDSGPLISTGELRNKLKAIGNTAPCLVNNCHLKKL